MACKFSTSYSSSSPKTSWWDCNVILLALLLTCQAAREILAGPALWVKDPFGEVVFEDGDINIGLIYPISQQDNMHKCGQLVDRIDPILHIETAKFAISQANKNSSLLPGVKLGYVVMDDCNAEPYSIMRASRLVPRMSTCSETNLSANFMAAQAVVGCTWSRSAVLTSLTLAPFSIPIISPSVSSEELTNKVRFPNFFSLVLSESHQVKAMMSFIQVQGWQEISILHGRDAYGVSGHRGIVDAAKPLGICIDADLAITDVVDDIYCFSIVLELLEKHHARVILVFGTPKSAECILRGVIRVGADQKAVWLASDTWDIIFTPTFPRLRCPPGLFVFQFQHQAIPGFMDHLDNEIRASTNPWIARALGHFESCNNGACNVKDLLSVTELGLASHSYDSVLIIAQALDILLGHKCYRATGSRARLCACENKHNFIDIIKHFSFYGVTGRTTFDISGFRNTKYSIVQGYNNRQGRIMPQEVAVYDVLKGLISRPVPTLWSGFHDNQAPRSACVEPCELGEIKLMVGCCSVCSPCKLNEITVDNETVCVACPAMKHPDMHFKSCIPIPAKFFLTLSHSGVIVAVSLTVLGITITQAILAVYIAHRKHIVIKSSSLELSVLQLISILFGYIGAALLLTPPTKPTCVLSFALLSISFDTLYAAALLKAIRVYRIFNRKKGTQSLKYTSALTQVIAMMFFTILDTSVSILLHWLAPADVSLWYGEVTDEFAEIYCHFPSFSVAVFLTTNLLLLFLCSYFAFKTRKLPHRYTESTYVAMCVTASIMTWLAFMSVFNVPNKGSTRTLLLCYVIILNQLVATFFFFLTRLYQLLTKEEKELRHTFLNLDKLSKLTQEYVSRPPSRRISALALRDTESASTSMHPESQPSFISAFTVSGNDMT